MAGITGMMASFSGNGDGAAVTLPGSASLVLAGVALLTMPYRREAGRHQQLITLIRRQAEFACTMQYILSRARAGNQPFLPAKNRLPLHAHCAGSSASVTPVRAVYWVSSSAKVRMLHADTRNGTQLMLEVYAVWRMVKAKSQGKSSAKQQSRQVYTKAEEKT